MEEHYLERKAILRTEKYKYIEAKSKKEATCIKCNKIHGGIIELYDLENDPEEKINLAKTNEKLLIEMKTKLDKKIKDLKTSNEKRRLNQVLSKV
jgi:arylsulfatase A-like enzyme